MSMWSSEFGPNLSNKIIPIIRQIDTKLQMFINIMKMIMIQSFSPLLLA